MDSRHPVPARAAPAALRRVLAAAFLLGAGLQGAAAQGYSWSSDSRPESWGEAPPGYGRTYGPPRNAYFNDAVLSPRSVVYGLHDRGFSEIGRPSFDGAAYRVEATSPRGLRVRLVVDARDGAVIGRERLTGPDYFPSDRLRPPVPGYGWTEEEASPPRRLREAERIVPPADIPSAPPLRAGPLEVSRSRPERPGPALAPTLRPDANPLGVNPDAVTRQEAPRQELPRQESPRRAAKAAAPARTAAARVAPPAPAPSLRPAQTETTPAANTAAEAPAKPPEPAAEPTRTADSSPAPAEKPKDKSWQNPPADGARRNVRVIGGATVVPGGTGEAPVAGSN